MNNAFKYSESLRGYLNGQASTVVSISNWIGTLSDDELLELGDLIKTATRGKPKEDLARFLVVAMPKQNGEECANPPTRKNLERFLGVAYSTIVMERKERLQKSGKHFHRPNGSPPCSCCS